MLAEKDRQKTKQAKSNYLSWRKAIVCPVAIVIED